MRHLKFIALLFVFGLVWALAPLAQELPQSTIPPPAYDVEVTLTPTPPTLEVTQTPEPPLATLTPDLSILPTPDISTSTPEPSHTQQIQMLSPDRRARIAAQEITFSWSEIPNAVSYRFKIFNAQPDQALLNRVLKPGDFSCLDQVCTLQFANLGFSLSEGTSYRWQIIAQVPANRIASGKRLFTVVNTAETGRNPLPVLPVPYAFSPNELIIFVAQITTNYIPRNSVNIYDGFNRKRSEVIYEGDLLITGETITRLGDAAYLSYDGQLLLFLCALNNSATNDICLADLVDAGSGQTPRFSAINPRAIIRSSTQKSLGGWASNTRRFAYWEQGIANFVYDVDTGQTQQLNLNKASLRWEQDGKLYFTKQLGFTYASSGVNAANTGLFRYDLWNNSEARILDPNNYPLYIACQGNELPPLAATLNTAHKNFAVSPQRDIIAYLGTADNRYPCYIDVTGQPRLETIVKYKGQNAQHGDSAFGDMATSYSMEWSPIHTGYLAVVSGNTLRILFVGNIEKYLVAYTLQEAASHDISLQSGQGNLAIPRTNPLHWVVLPPPQAPTPTPTPSPTLTPTFTPTPSPTLPYCDELPPTPTPHPLITVEPTLSCPPGVICPDPSPTGIAMRPGEVAAPQSLNGNTCQVRPTATPSATVTPTATNTSTPSFTSLRLNDKDSALKAVIFWALFNETSSDVDDSGSPTDNFDLGSPRFSDFLFKETPMPNYCAPGNGPGDNGVELPFIDNFWYLRHCPLDHRAMFARTMMNGFLNYERRGLDPFEFAKTNFSGSIGESTYYLWRNEECYPGGESYSSVFNTGYEPQWLHQYLLCMANPNGDYTQTRVARAYQFTIYPQINVAVNNFEDLTGPDYTKGAFQTKHVNYTFSPEPNLQVGKSQITCVGGCWVIKQGATTATLVDHYETCAYKDGTGIDRVCDTFQSFAQPLSSISQSIITDYYTRHVTAKVANYIPVYHSVGQPILRWATTSNPPYSHAGYLWITNVYQQTLNMIHYPR